MPDSRLAIPATKGDLIDRNAVSNWASVTVLFGHVFGLSISLRGMTTPFGVGVARTVSMAVAVDVAFGVADGEVV
jgi:hypothetical protein